MTNVVKLHGEKRWRAVIEYEHQTGPISIEHFFEEISELHNIIERGPDWSTLVHCTVTLNRNDEGGHQNASEKAQQRESH